MLLKNVRGIHYLLEQAIHDVDAELNILSLENLILRLLSNRFEPEDILTLRPDGDFVHRSLPRYRPGHEFRADIPISDASDYLRRLCGPVPSRTRYPFEERSRYLVQLLNGLYKAFVDRGEAEPEEIRRIMREIEHLMQRASEGDIPRREVYGRVRVFAKSSIAGISRIATTRPKMTDLVCPRADSDQSVSYPQALK